MIARQLALCGFVALFAAGLAPAAKAQTPGYMTAFVGNATNMTITYQYNYKNGPWQTISLQPGQIHTFKQPISDSPTGYTMFKVRYDNYLGDGKLTLSTGLLTVTRAGWRHKFVVSGRKLDLQSRGGTW